jgi:hypothetical protein
MSVSLDALRPGDTIAIQYRLWRPMDGTEDDVVERWISARIIDCEDGAWPLARLVDGQTTDVRPFMTWRWVARAKPLDVAIAA